MRPWRVRTLMIVVLFLAVYHEMMVANGSAWAVVVFLVLNVAVPILVGLWLIVRRIRRDHTRSTLY